MTAPALTRLGVLRTSAHGYYDAGEQVAGGTIHTIDGLLLRLDATGGTAPLYPGEGYELRPNDGWAVDRDVDHGPGHWAHLITPDGSVATELPLTEGFVALDRAHHYLVRQDGRTREWHLYRA